MIRPNPNNGDQGEAYEGGNPEKLPYQLMKQAVANRWNISEEKRQEMIDLLLIDVAQATKSRDRARSIALLVKMEAMNQSDQHLTDKNDRLDDGKLTDNIQLNPMKFQGGRIVND